MRIKIVIPAILLVLGSATLMLLLQSDDESIGPPVSSRNLESERTEPLDPTGREDSAGPLRVLTESTSELEAGFRTAPELDRLKLARDARIRVTVLGPDRQPQPGATVRLEPAADSAPSDRALGDQRLSDARGQVVFEVPRTGTFQLKATRDVLTSERMLGVRPGSTVVLVLAGNLPFSGRLFAADTGEPVRDALVLYTFGEQTRQTTSNAEGRFELKLPHKVRGRLEVLARGYARKKTWVDTQQGPLELALEVGHLLTGSVSDAAGGVVRSATVRTLARRQVGPETLTVVLAESRTDPLGHFELGPTACDQVVIEAVSGQGDRAALELDRSAAQRALKLVLPDRNRLVGQVLLANGEPAASARIRLLGLGSSEASARRVVADQEGRFGIDRIQTRRSYRLAVWHPEGTPAILESQALGRLKPLVIRLAPANGLRGRVSHQDASPAPFAVLRLEHDDPGLVRAADLRERIRSDSLGRFRIRAVPPGTWRLSVSFEDQAAGPLDVSVRPGEETDLQVELEGRVSLQGLLSDELGRPLASGSVEAFGLSGQAPEQESISALARAQVDAAGHFRLELLPVGRPLELRAASAGYEQQRVDLPRPEQNWPVVIRMKPLLALSGQVLNRLSGAPLERFSLTVKWTDTKGLRSERKRSFASADGSFRFEGLEPGTLELTVKSRGYFRFGPEALVLGPASVPLLVRLDPAAQVDGRLLDDRGRPLAGTFVFLRETRPSGEEPQLRRSRSRADGSFTLRELQSGRYELGVGRLEAPLKLIPLSVRIGRNRVKDIRLAQVGSAELELSGPKGRPVGERVVRFVGLTLKARLSVVSDARGRVLVGPLPADTYDVLCDGVRSFCEIKPGAVTPLRLSLPAEEGGP